MAFCTVPGLRGKVFTPDPAEKTEHKHRCPDCFACQRCGEDRCRVCRGAGNVTSGRPTACPLPEKTA